MSSYGNPVSLALGSDSRNGAMCINIGVAQVDYLDVILSEMYYSKYITSSVVQVLIDSGSCGIVVPAAILYSKYDESDIQSGTLLSGVTTSYEPATITYHPSGNEINGYYYTIEYVGLGECKYGNPQVVAANVTVIGSTNTDSCMMGVGFSRPLNADNVFLASILPGVGSAENAAPSPVNVLYPSYYLAGNSVTLGIQASSIDNAVLCSQTLSQVVAGATNQQTRWSGVSGAISIGTLLEQTSVNILLDTGLNLMMINDLSSSIPAPTSTSAALLQTLNVYLASGTSGTFVQAYSFELTSVGQAQLQSSGSSTPVYETPNSVVSGGLVNLDDASSTATAAPTLVAILDGTASVGFVNTGFNPLFQYGMLFDANLGSVTFFTL